MWGDGAGGARRMTGRVTHLWVRGEICLGLSALSRTQRGMLEPDCGSWWSGAELCTEWVCMCACVLLGRRVGAGASRVFWGGGGDQKGAARLFVPPGDLGRDRERQREAIELGSHRSSCIGFKCHRL